MRVRFLLLFCIGVTCSQGVQGSPENEPIKKGAFPYMGFIYYMDTSVVDATGARFMRSAVLIRPEWLVTSALGPSVIDNGFPKKTLLARVGAVSVDLTFTLHEDEDEQDREVIQIVRPYNHSATQWWTTDISLMKTLLPFNMTSSVGIIDIINRKIPETWKTCTILAYTMDSNETKSLVKMFVDILPPADSEKCGTHFSADTMVCGVDNVVDEAAPGNNSNFCQGNSGGPLIHEDNVMGLQTYVDNNCKPPHLYQLFTSWDSFINCSIEDKCQEEHCGKTCDVTYKDPPKSEALKEKTSDTIIQTTTSEITQPLTVKDETETTLSSPPPSTSTLAPTIITLASTSISTLASTTTSTLAPVSTYIQKIPKVYPTRRTSPTTIDDIETLPAYYNTFSLPEERERQVLVEAEKPLRRKVLVHKAMQASSAKAMCLMQTLVLILVLLFVIN